MLIEVSGVGALRVLRGLCERIRQKGVVKARALKNLRRQERAWIDKISKWTTLDDSGVCDLLCKFYVDVIGFEDDLNKRALRLLQPIFGHSADEAWRKIQEAMADKDGIVAVHTSDVWQLLPSPSADELDTFYWSLVEQVETSFNFDQWVWLTDHLVRDIIPISFYGDVLDLVQSIESCAWPGRYPQVEAKLRNLSHHAHEYVRYFDTRSDATEKWIREDRSYKRVFPNPDYEKESKAARRWRRGVQKRLCSMVVAINQLFSAVRDSMSSTYRLREGRLGIHDLMGVTNHMQPTVWYPKEDQ